ncbi:hypothetical protein JCM11491_006905 [Sporobolomyces phaffii]
MSLTAAARVPHEVLDHVLSYVRAFDEDDVVTTTLRSAMLVCKLWLVSAIKALYFDPTRWHARWNTTRASNLRDSLKSRPQLARLVKHLSKLATYSQTVKDVDYAGKWCWEVIRACKNVELLEIPIRLQRSILLSIEATNSLEHLRHLVVKPSTATDTLLAAHEFVCALRPVDNKLDTLVVSKFAKSSQYLPFFLFTTDRPHFSVQNLSFASDDFIEFVYPQFISPHQTRTIRSLDLMGTVTHTEDEESMIDLQELAKLSVSTLEALRIRAPSKTRRRPCRLDDYGRYHKETRPQLNFSFKAFFFGNLSYAALRSFKLEGFGSICTAALAALAYHCRLLETVSFRDSTWDIDEWSVPEETCDDIRDWVRSLIYLTTLHLGNLPILSHDATFRRVIQFCDRHALSFAYVPCLDKPSSPRPFGSSSPQNRTRISSSTPRIGLDLADLPLWSLALPFPVHWTPRQPLSWGHESDVHFPDDDHGDGDVEDGGAGFLNGQSVLLFDPSYRSSSSSFPSSTGSALETPVHYVPASPWIPRLAEGFEAKDPVDDVEKEEPWESWSEECDIEGADERWRAGEDIEQ